MKTNIIPIVLAGLMCTAVLSCKEDEAGNEMKVYSFLPQSPATLKFNDFVLIEYNYNIVHPEGARMWVIPFTNGDKSPGYLYSSSNVYTGTGGRQVGISIEDGDGPVVVDQVHVIMKNPDQSTTLFEQYINVNYTFEE